ncbi:N-(5'-phosphoribosyl)anthranilate isomerase [subsurface metagenome]
MYLQVHSNFTLRDIKKKKRITQLIQDIRSKITKPLVIGGGFKTINVGKIIHDLLPDAVDVSSGVERITGIKDSAMMQEFLQTVYDFKESLSGVDVTTI